VSFKENLKAKISLDRLVQAINSSIREGPSQRRVDKDLMRKLLAMSQFKQEKARDLELYVRIGEAEQPEVLVLDNELAIYRTSIDDVALRKSPDWKEMFSISNIKKILNDKDVIASKGKESLKRVYNNVFSLLDLTYGQQDIAELVAEASRALEQQDMEQIQESFDLFFELLRYQAVNLSFVPGDTQTFARVKGNGMPQTAFEDLLLFKEEGFWLGLLRGTFSPQQPASQERILACARRDESADFEGAEVFDYLGKLALQEVDRKITPLELWG